MINTLDLDGYTWKEICRIKNRIERLPCCESVEDKPSCHKGYHIIIHCKKKDCDLCRFVFDDAKRYEHDISRPVRTRNVLFQEYEYYG